MGRDVLGSPLAELARTSQRNPFAAVVVGGGSAGLIAARTLAEGGMRVAVLEAGPAPFLTHITNTEIRFSADLTRAARERVAYRPADLAEGGAFRDSFSCLGGRGLFWNGSAPRFQPHDFRGWPFDADEVEPHYQWAERAFRVTDAPGRTDLAQRLIRKLREGGFDARPGPFAVDLDELGAGHLSAGIASVLAPFFRAVGEQVATEQIQVALEARTTRVLLSGGEAQGVTAIQSEEGDEHEILAHNVVLACGGIESIRLAGLSGVPDPAERIGVGLQDHSFYRCYFEGPQIYGTGGRESAILHIPSASQETEQWEIQAPGRLLWTMDEDFAWRPEAGPAYQVMIRSFVATEKRDRNRVEVREGGLGAATVHFEYSSADEARRERMQEQALAVGGALGLTLVEDRLTGPGNSYHEAGGLDMGDDPAGSVTDREGRFHHVSNLFCVDAAAFPRIGATNPHLTIVAESRRKSLALLAAS